MANISSKHKSSVMRFKLILSTSLLLLTMNFVQAKPQFGKAVLIERYGLQRYPNDPQSAGAWGIWIVWWIGNAGYGHPVLDHANINQPVQGGYLPNNPKAERLSGISKRLAAVVRGFDTSLPVTAGLAGVVMSNETEYPGNLDVTGYNYSEERYARDHAKYPKRVIFGSENGQNIEAWKNWRTTTIKRVWFIGISLTRKVNWWWLGWIRKIGKHANIPCNHLADPMPLSYLQLELMKVSSLQLNDIQLYEISDLLAKYFAKNATNEMDKLWNDNNWSNN